MERVLILIGLVVSIKAQPFPATDSIFDIDMLLHERSINKVLNGIQDIQGTQTYTYLILKGTYHWTVTSMAVHIESDSTYFNALAKVHIAGINYEAPVTGRMDLTYQMQKNKIQLKLMRAPFQIKTELFGKPIILKTIELAEYIKQPFEFEGPQYAETSWQTTMPDGSYKKIKMTTCACKLIPEQKRVRVKCNLNIQVSNIPKKIKNK